MPKLQDLREKRATIVQNARTEYAKAEERAKAENRDVSADEEGALDKAMNEADELTKQIDVGEKAEEARAANLNRLSAYEQQVRAVNRGPLGRLGGSGVNSNLTEQQQVDREADENAALRGWFLNQLTNEVPEECVEAGKRVGINPNAKNLDFKLPSNYGDIQRRYQNALGSNDPSKGGILRLGSVLGPMEVAMLDFGPMLQTSQVIRTSDANPLPWPTANDTANTGRQIGEARATTEAADPSFKAMTMGAYKFTSDEILVSYELLRDSSIDLASLIGEMLGERLGRVLNTKATLGPGASTMMGIVPASALGKTTASNSAITSDELIDLQHSVPSAYRKGAQFMFNDSTLKVIRKLKSNDNQYLWQPGLQAGVPGQILQSGYQINDDMASIASQAKVALYGQLNRYKMRQVGKVRLYRLTERERANDQDVFLCFIEADGNLLDAGKGPIRHMAMNT